MDIDLALLTFEELRHLAKQHPIDGAESKSRVDLVVSLRQAGVGVTPIKANEVSTSSSLKSLNELVCVVIELREQLEQAKHDNAIVSSLRDEVSSLKLEVLELRNFTTGALSQTANDTHNRRTSANEVTVEPSLYETETSITTAPQSLHTSTSQHARSSSNDRTLEDSGSNYYTNSPTNTKTVRVENRVLVVVNRVGKKPKGNGRGEK